VEVAEHLLASLWEEVALEVAHWEQGRRLVADPQRFQLPIHEALQVPVVEVEELVAGSPQSPPAGFPPQIWRARLATYVEPELSPPNQLKLWWVLQRPQYSSQLVQRPLYFC